MGVFSIFALYVRYTGSRKGNAMSVLVQMLFLNLRVVNPGKLGKVPSCQKWHENQRNERAREHNATHVQHLFFLCLDVSKKSEPS